MSFGARLNHRVSRWRPTESTGVNQAVDRAYGAAATGILCAVQRVQTSNAPGAGGELQAGTFKLFAAAAADFRANDIVLITSGPTVTAGYLKIDGDPYVPRGHHLEAVLVATREDPTA